MVQTRDANPIEVSIVGITHNCADVIPSYVEHYYAQDFWTQRAMRHVGESLIGEQIVPVDELVHSELYGDLLKPHGIHHLVGAVFELQPQVIGAIGIHRPADADPFEETDRARMALLLPHLRQALRLMRMADSDRRARRLSFETLAKLSVAVFVVSGDRRVRIMNSAAERLIRAGADILVRQGCLALANTVGDEQLRLAVRTASLAPIGRSLDAGGTIVVPRRAGPALSLLVSPLPAETGPFGPPEPLAAVFVGEPSAARPAAATNLGCISAIYGLTPAETRVLFALLEGRNLPAYAKDARISLNTARAQLKSIFGKTGCHSQVEVVRMVMSDPLLRLTLA